MKKMKLKNGDKKYRIKQQKNKEKFYKKIEESRIEAIRNDILGTFDNIFKDANFSDCTVIANDDNTITATLERDMSPMVDKERKMKVFFDTEFTGLHKNTTLISLGIVSEFGDTFYAEFTDYNKKDVDSWIQENVINKLQFNDSLSETIMNLSIIKTIDFEIKGTKEQITDKLKQWLNMICERYDYTKVEFWSDCLAWDWVLFVDLFGSSFDLPSCVYPYPMDIVTMFRERNIDPDVNREAFVYFCEKDDKHNALYDAKIIRDCYDLLKCIGVR